MGSRDEELDNLASAGRLEAERLADQQRAQEERDRAANLQRQANALREQEARDQT